MFADPLAITYNAAAKNLNRINQDGYTSEYFLDGTTLKFTASVKHTIPAKGGSGESHMLRLDVDTYDASGVYVRRCSAWVVAKTFDNSQNSTDLGYALDALITALTTTNKAKLLGREV
jgi:hypothetical protein